MEKIKQLSIKSANGRDVSGSLCRGNEKVIILSNMDTNDPEEWSVLTDRLLKSGYTIVSYKYNHERSECLYDLLDVMNHVNKEISEKFILAGASRGGVISLKAAIDSEFKDIISAVIAMSAPQMHEGELFYQWEDFKKIKIPVFLINSEFDDAVSDTIKMHEMIEARKEMMICTGNGHGTEMFYDNRDILLERMEKFISGIT